ncbi:protein FAM214A isoform X10 [Carcharodon carcharias]|uniref:protein FAM214A isoform X10 n=1 Tax=Carcharodon carcharias TaxID=13397 RepID=UPI001B7EB263|nr:protein FAM214A isoform X10 [Carcharodon carcharias]
MDMDEAPEFQPPDTIDEYFEYDAEEFLLSLTLLITEGRTPECSAKGRTEGFHCPPAQLGQSLSTKHECIDKVPQCCQARRTRSQVLLLWRNNISIMVEVMLLPDCCYSDADGPSTEGSDINDPAIKQDALLLERWSLQSVPKQIGDRFIEEKSLLQAVRSYVFFSQLSAWLSASQGAVPRNILYRISATDEDMLLNFAQPPVEHVFPVPNISHNMALRVSVLSLPRQPSYPLLTCSIHSNLSFYGKNIPSREKDASQPTNAKEQDYSVPGAQQKYNKQTLTAVRNHALLSTSTVNTRKCPSPEILEPGKPTVLSDSDKIAEIRNSQTKTQCCNWATTAEVTKVQPYETQTMKTLKSFSMADSSGTSSTSSPIPSGEMNPLIGNLLQEREEVIARIAQQLSYCDQNPPHIAGSHFSTVQEPCSTSAKLFQSSCNEESLKSRGKEIPCSSTNFTESSFLETRRVEKSRTSSQDTPVTLCRKAKADIDKTACPKPQTQRKLFPVDCIPYNNGTSKAKHPTERTNFSKSPLKPSGNFWKKQNRRSLDGISTKVFHPCTGLPLLSSPVPPRKKQSGYFDLDTSLQRLKGVPCKSQRQYLRPENDADQGKQLLSVSAPPATSLSLLGNFEESILNFRLEPLGSVDGFTAEVGASGTFCPSHMTLPVEVSFYSVSDDNAPSPYMGVINLETLGKRGYRVPPSGTIQVTLFNPNKTVVKMFVVIYDLRDMPANHQTFLRQRTFSVPVKRETVGHANKENVIQTEERILRYLVHLRFQSSKSGKIYLHRDVRLLFSRKSMEVDSGAAYELKSYTEIPTNPHFSRC